MNEANRAEFIRFFGAAFRDKEGNPQTPFEYQCRLALEPALPSLVNAPTGAGKTNAIVGTWLWRRLHNPESVGRRLVYCLPMRTLVEQTRDVTRAAIKNLEEQGLIEKYRFSVHVLMGGDVTDEWDSWPERECILIGTQDMLLSRALNRGYAMSRFRWPLHFGLLNNDCLWVFDEVQLMSDGLATTAQLAAFRTKFQTIGHAHSIWMSATLDREWLKMVDFKTQVDGLPLLTLSEADRATPVLAQRLTAVKHLQPAPPSCRPPQGLAAFVKANHQVGTQTLVVVNRVARARETYSALDQKYSGVANKPEIKLIHSRFRPEERKQWRQLFDPKTGAQDRIIVATQVVEAGVDISSRLLITDLAPYSSMVQRFGRCNREGKHPEAFIYWIDRPLDTKDDKLKDKVELDDNDRKKIAAPYAWDDLQRAQEPDCIGGLASAAPADLPEHSDPYRPAHVLRKRDVIDLFDTTPDLSGYDIDVSRFVRGGEERDVTVAWRDLNGEAPSKKAPALTRNELCPVAIGNELRDFLKGKDKQGKQRKAWRWDALEGNWEEVGESDLRPGLSLLLDVTAGGYSEELGWNKESTKPVTPVPLDQKEINETNDSFDADQRTFQPSKWKKYNQTLAAHSSEARTAAEKIIAALDGLPLSQWQVELIDATHHHDWGKVHEIFQETLHRGQPDSLATIPLAKSNKNLPNAAGKKGHGRKHFRHELASALALLQTGASNLTIYLAACHHGKVRLGIRAVPGEEKPKTEDPLYARGIWQDDPLSSVDLGDGVIKAKVKLNLEPMLLGATTDGARSWLERMIALRDELGVFRLAFLECLIRAADVRASEFPQDYWPKEDSQ
jgi:CRISPR-associated endonuclease/helicase Cas3